jgi:dephospho-CoA kinase
MCRPDKQERLVLGITGNIACGKTSVGNILLELGAERYIDADAVVHRLYEPGQPLAHKIAQVFGADVMCADGSVDRKALGDIVFSDADALRRLEQIVHPAVHDAIEQELSQVSAGGIAVIDAVKLLEGGSGAYCQSKWLVVCAVEQEIVRLQARNGLNEQEARARLGAQPSVEARLPLVDEVIDNSGTLDETRLQTIAAFGRFRRKLGLYAL